MARRRALGGVHTKAERLRVAVRGVFLATILCIVHVHLVALGGILDYALAQVTAIPAAVRVHIKCGRIYGQRAARRRH